MKKLILSAILFTALSASAQTIDPPHLDPGGLGQRNITAQNTTTGGTIKIVIKCKSYGTNLSYYGYGVGLDGKSYQYSSQVINGVRRNVATEVSEIPSTCV